MAITETNILLLKSERMTDASDGGGLPTGNAIADGASNNIFPDISELDRTVGRVNLRKTYVAVQTATDPPETYYGAHAIVADPPDDPRVSAVLFKTGSFSDERADAVSRMESYLARGARVSGYLYGNHIAGQRTLLVLANTAATPPAEGAVWVVVARPGAANEAEQYVRITRVQSQNVTLTDENNNQVNKLQLTLTISDPLLFDVLGYEARAQDYKTTDQSMVADTVVADAARYYGCRPLVTAADTGDYTVQADGIYEALVPAARSETPVTDATPNGAVATPLAAGGQVSLSTSVSLSPTASLYVGGGIQPGTLAVEIGGVANALADRAGRLVDAQGEDRGTVDYANGVLSINAGGQTYSGDKVVRYKPSVRPQRNLVTRSIAVTLAGRSQTIVGILDPIPAPGTMQVSYRAQGNWYVLTDDGSGALRGGDSGYGSGQVNFTTGSIAVTLGALPDVGTLVLLVYGTALSDVQRAGATVKAAMTLALGRAVAPGDLTITWPDGQTADDDGKGNLTGDATGTVDYATGAVSFAPTTMPPVGATITVAAGTQSATALLVNTARGSVDVNGRSVYQLGQAIVPGSLRVRATYHADLSLSWQAQRSFVFGDDGLGALTGQLTGGTVNYATGEVRLPAGAAIQTNYQRGEWSPFTAQWVTRNTAENASYAVLAGTVQAFEATTAAAAAASPAQTFAWAPAVDLTPSVTEPVVPGSVRFELAGKVYLDRQGALVTDVSPSTGAATSAGSINYTTGACALTLVADGAANTGTVSALVTSIGQAIAATADFRIPAGSIVPGSLTVQWVVAATGASKTEVLPSSGVVELPGIVGTVDHTFGLARLTFGTRVTAAGNEGQPWYDPDAVDGEGKIVRPEPAIAETIRYAAVAYSFIPLPADIIGVNGVRLPSDGRVPIFADGEVAVVHHTATVSGTYSNGQTVNLGRTRIARLRVRDNTGAPVDAARYTANLDAGTVQWVNVAGLAQPLTIEHRIEDMALVADAQINGVLTFTRPITHDYPASGAYVSSALLIGDMTARYTSLFEQSTWTAEWSDSRIGSQPTASYNDSLYPIAVTNAGTLTERWAIIFTNTTSFRLVGEIVGEIATGNTSTDLAPINPASGAAYFALDADGWGTGWAAGNVLRFNTIAAAAPIWIARAIQQGPAGAQNDSFSVQVRGDVDTP